MGKGRRQVETWLMLMSVVLLVGCQPRPMPEAQVPTGPLPSYGQLVARYNANLAGLDQFWSRAVVEMEYQDRKNRRRFEQGEGNLLVVGPQRVALSVGKLGNVLMWAGGDEQRFWLFELHEDKVAYVGRHENVGKPCAQELPLPVQPRDLPRLLGVVPIDGTPVPTPPEVEAVRGGYLIEPPGTGTRLLLDPVTALPVRIDLLDAQGRTVVTGLLSSPKSVEMSTPATNKPTVHSHLRISVIGRSGQLTLFLSDLSDGKDDPKINPRVFDFERLMTIHKPGDLIVLDRDCLQPSVASATTQPARE